MSKLRYILQFQTHCNDLQSTLKAAIYGQIAIFIKALAKLSELHLER